jgi:hypothetical protein
MKTLFLFFLLLNAAYFYFQTSAEDDSATTVLLKQPQLPAGSKPLVLLRERGLRGVESGQVATASSKNSSQETAVNQAKQVLANKTPELSAKPREKKITLEPKKSVEAACFTFGPFAESGLADRAVEAASALGVTVDRRQESQRTPKGYWVYLPPSSSYQAAKRKVTEMKKKGLKDLFIMGKGSQKNAISLGLFKNKEAAEDRFTQVKQLGLKAAFETQYRVSEQSWLDMSVAGDQTATVAALTEMAEDFPEASLTQRKCR